MAASSHPSSARARARGHRRPSVSARERVNQRPRRIKSKEDPLALRSAARYLSQTRATRSRKKKCQEVVVEEKEEEEKKEVYAGEKR